MKRSAGWVPCVNRPKCARSLWNYVRFDKLSAHGRRLPLCALSLSKGTSPRFDKLSAHIATRSASGRAQAQETARHRRR